MTEPAAQETTRFQPWTHDAERVFILGLGKFVNETYLDEGHSLERTERLLLGYIDSIDMRDNWPDRTRVEVLREIARNKLKRVRKAMREGGHEVD